MAAGCLMVEESGGIISNMSGGKWDIYSPDVLISNGLIHEQMISIFKRTACQ
jgi:myo-inositol-1(or 4)-monophosphatase